MSSEGDATAAGPTAQSDTSHDLLGLGERASGHGGRSPEQSDAQNHNRNISGSSSIYSDAADSGNNSSCSSKQSAARDQSQSGLEERGAKLKGKERSHAVLEQLHEPVGAGASFAPQSSGVVNLEGGLHDVPPTTAESTRPEQPRQRVLPSEIHLLDSQIPDTPRNTNSSNMISADLTSTRIPVLSEPSFDAPVSAEEDRKNWERIQAIAGPSTSVYSSVPVVTASSPGRVAQDPPRLAQKRKSISGDTIRRLDGARTSVSEAHLGHTRPPPYDESFTPVGNIPRSHQTRQPENQTSSQEVVVPRWQPDAEVTICPICATQFSRFFVRATAL